MIENLKQQLEESSERESEASIRAATERRLLLNEVGELKEERRHLHMRLKEMERRTVQLERECEVERTAVGKLRLQHQATNSQLSGLNDELGQWRSREEEWLSEKGALTGKIADLGELISRKAAEPCGDCAQTGRVVAERDELREKIVLLRKDSSEVIAELRRGLQNAANQAKDESRKVGHTVWHDTDL